MRGEDKETNSDERRDVEGYIDLEISVDGSGYEREAGEEGIQQGCLRIERVEGN